MGRPRQPTQSRMYPCLRQRRLLGRVPRRVIKATETGHRKAEQAKAGHAKFRILEFWGNGMKMRKIKQEKKWGGVGRIFFTDVGEVTAVK